MKLGTRSLLFGAHQVLIHPWYVAKAWIELYGFPRDPRVWIAILVHDWGYWGKSDMDGAEGERHVELGARIMERLFGWAWGDFCRYHSRASAAAAGKPVSRLCYADKLSMALMPQWLYLALARATGELDEYMARTDAGIYAPTPEIWFRNVCAYLARWVGEETGAAD